MKRLLLFSIITLSIFFAIGCGRQSATDSTQDQDVAGYSAYVSAYSAGMLNSGSAVSIVFTNEVSHKIREKENPEKLFKFTPKIKGSAVWMTDRMLEFLPEEPLKNGTEYHVDFDLAEIVDAGEKHKNFSWKFRIIDQAMSVQLSQVMVKEKIPEYASFVIYVMTSDFSDNKEIEEAVRFIGNDATTLWDHSADGKEHILTVSGIARNSDDKIVTVSWNGKAVGAAEKGEIEVTIPGKNIFKVMEVKTFPDPDKYIQISFSDILDSDPDIEGLIYLGSGVDLNLVRDENIIKAYPIGNTELNEELLIDGNLMSHNGTKLGDDYMQNIRFEAMKPQIRWIGDGVILPDGKNLIVPFEAVNLNAVDVSVVRIYESNLPQFFQDNSYSSTYQLKRVGRLILKEKIDLTGDIPINRNAWNTFSIDLSQLITSEPGAMYSIELDFNINYSTYLCQDSEADPDQEKSHSGFLKDDPEYKEYDDPNYHYYSSGYYGSNWWENRDNPCFISYYNNKSIKRNILASNVGLVTKKSSDNKLHVFIHDILTSGPVAGATVTVLNYQQQPIAVATTDNLGNAVLSPDQTPWLVLAESKRQKGYLTLLDGEALSLSRFDVSGQACEKGLKGFIYGERGVWRPGDTLYLSFILNDKNNPVPAEHPVLLELFDPLGRNAWRQVQKLGEGKINSFVIPTGADDITGAWNAKVTVGGAIFTKQIRIETIKPNRLKIQLDYPDTLQAWKDMNIPVRVEYLHGAKAPNLKFVTEIKLTPVQPEFAKYKDFVFHNPAVYFDEHRYDDIHEKLDANGTVVLSVPAMNSTAPGFVKAEFASRAYENSGEFSVDYSSVLMSPYKQYVGLKVPGDSDYWNRLETDKNHPLEIVTVDAGGNPVAMDGIEVDFYKIKWNWWYENSGSYASFVNNRNVKPVMSTTVSTKNGVSKTNFKIDYDDWGRYLVYVKLPNGHATGKEIFVDWPGWSSRKTDDDKHGASLLSVKTDKDKYVVGEKVTLSFPGAENGTAVITLENGSGILHKRIISTTGGDNVFEFEVLENMTPNIYACVHFMQPHSHPGNDLPIRLYGVAPVMVEDPATKITPMISMKDELRSKEKTTITVTEKDGKEMYYTLAVVDEGLLGLTHFKTPSPHKYFYAREALGIKTWDMYDEIIGAFAGNMAAVFAIGGDEDLSGDDDGKKKRFKPVVKFYGPYKLNKGKKEKLELQLPEYVGAVRVMVVAVSGNAYGSAEKEVIVKDPLMVHATLPRVLSPGETVNVPVTIFAMDDKITSVDVTFDATGGVSISDAVQSVKFDEQGEKMLFFEVITGDASGDIGFDVTATSGGETATEHIDVTLRNPNPYQTVMETELVQAGESKTIPVKLLGVKNSASYDIEVAAIPPLGVSRIAEYMMRYPHICSEQTTSAAMVQMLLPSLLETKDPRFDNAQQNVTDILGGLRKYQNSNGGIGMWPGSYYASPWTSCYVGHFLAVAGETGYAVPQDVKQKLLHYLSGNSFNDLEDGYLSESYRFYVLALHGKTDYSGMNRLKGKDLTPPAKLRLAAAYAVAGKTNIAKGMLDKVKMVDYYGYNYNHWNYYYFSSKTAMAMALETAILVDDEEVMADVAMELSKILSGKEYLDTHSSAWGVYAMWRLYGNEKKGGVISYQYTCGDVSYALNTSNAVSQSALPLNESIDTTLTFENRCERKLFVNTISGGQPAPGDETEDKRNLEMEVTYVDARGYAINPKGRNLGDDFFIEVRVTNPGIAGKYKNMALTLGIPGGWEFIGLMRDQMGVQQANVEYIDIRDDKVSVYFSLNRYETITIPVRVHASYSGKYYMPAVMCYEMYDQSIYALKKGQWIDVMP